MRERTPRGISSLFLLLTLLAVTTESARAQISPGPLSRAHEDLEGVSHCLDCHGIGKASLDPKCLACHTEIEWLRDRGRGLHAQVADQECGSCHGEHSGREFEVVHWGEGSPDRFRHERAGWALEGKHRETACEKCHAEERQASSTFPVSIGWEPRAGTYLGLETECAACHADPHEGRLGGKCAECHTAHGFRQVLDGSFDHERTRYPLRGKHVGVSCESCHPAGQDTRLPAFDTCTACHSDVHAGQATLAGQIVDCDACHGLAGFAPSRFTLASHDATPYPLVGKHRRVACAGCHRPVDAAARTASLGTAGFLFRPASSRCSDCHADAHAGQLVARADGGACSSCHTIDAFTPSTFTVADHDASRFPLHGRHRSAACAACHGPERPGLPALAANLGTARIAFRVDAGRCDDCHFDPHEGRFARGVDPEADRSCRPCHDERAFVPARVDVALHDTFEFTLVGAHRAVPCFECHRELQRSPGGSSLLLAAASVQLRFESGRTCLDCHRDEHGGQFRGRPDAGDCAACHGEHSFRPAPGFDHDRNARFKLEGAHEKVACAGCHFTGPRADGSEGVIYRPLIPHRCQDCHTVTPPPLEVGS